MEQEKRKRNKMQIRHVKNLYWLVLVIALIFSFSFSSNPFFFWTGLITALFALISILVGKPALMWLFWIYVIIVSLYAPNEIHV